MYYLDYAKQVGDRWILNFFADAVEDLKDVPTTTPYVTRNGTNYGIPLETSVVTIVEKGVKVNYVLQQGKYIAGGDIAPVVAEKTITENGTYAAKLDNLDGFSSVTVEVEPNLQEKATTVNGPVTADSGYDGLSKVIVSVETPTEEKTVELVLSVGDQVVMPATGKYLSKVTITKPATLLPENIKKGVVIAGVTGTYEATTTE